MELVRVTPDRFDAIVALFRQYAFALQERAQFDWKHLGGPLPQPQVYAVTSEGETVGTVALLPQPFRHGPREVIALQAVDALMGREVRGKHLFAEVLQRAVRAPLEGIEGPHFFIAFPSLPASAKGFANAGWTRVDWIRVYKALLTPALLRQARGGALLASLGAVLWPLVRLVLFRGAAPVSVRRVERFTEDMDRFQPQDRVCGRRTARFLNWRVIDCPMADLRAYVFAIAGTTVGYALCKRLPDTWHVMELRADAGGRACAAALLRHLYRTEGATSVEFWQPEGFLQKDLLPLGVLDRGRAASVFVYGAGALGLPEALQGWAAGYADADW